MSSAKMHLVSDIFKPGASVDYYIISDRLIYSNLRAGYPYFSGPWQHYSNVSVWDSATTWTYDHAWGVPDVGMDSWSSELPTLTFIFKDAAYKPISGGAQFLDLKVELRNSYAYNGDPDYDRDVILVALSDDTSTFNGKGFWVQSYLKVATGKSHYEAAGSVTVRLSLVNSSGVEQSGSFLYPFTDLDKTYDATAGTYTPGQRYSESIQITSGCSDIYALTGTPGPLGYGSWLNLTSDTDGVNTLVAYTNNVTYSYSLTDGYGLRFCNGYTDEDPENTKGAYTGITGKFSTGATVIWRGSCCGTSLKGSYITHKVTYNGNKNPSIGTGSVTNMPNPNPIWKPDGQPIVLSSTIPVHPVDGLPSGSRVVATFLGWNTAADGTGTTYMQGQSFNDDSHSILYAKWQFTYQYLVTFDLVDSRVPSKPIQGYGINNSQTPSVTAGPISYWVNQGSAIDITSHGWRFEALGYTIGGWSYQSSLYPVNRVPDVGGISGPMTVKAVWNPTSHSVRFRDGFNESGHDIIKEVNVAHGGSAESDAPVPSSTAIKYADNVYRVFQKGGFYRFKGWSGSLTNIRDNTDLVAIWEFVPIWQMKNGNWQKYQPVDNRETISNNSITIHQVSQYPQYGDPPHTNSPNIKMTLSGYIKQNADKSIDVTISQAYLNAGSYSDKFECDVFAWLVAFDDVITPSRLITNTYGKTYLFSKPMSTTSWSDNQIKLTSPATLRIPYSAYSSCTTNAAIKLVIGLMSICTCSATATTDTPVAVLHVTGRPDIDPYFYRYQDNHSLIDPHKEWVCTRPFYICKTINNVKGWCSCEDQTKLIYDADGRIINS